MADRQELRWPGARLVKTARSPDREWTYYAVGLTFRHKADGAKFLAQSLIVDASGTDPLTRDEVKARALAVLWGLWEPGGPAGAFDDWELFLCAISYMTQSPGGAA